MLVDRQELRITGSLPIISYNVIIFVPAFDAGKRFVEGIFLYETVFPRRIPICNEKS